ncbi:MAG: hypothetical protein SVM79_02480, partial [Chloroflexota bacterium]|nr:hypothetical protein [Chloroflexota bacterium]
FVMIDGRSTVQSETMSFLQQLLDDYNSGFLITAVKLQYAGPPTEVKDAFDEVVRAREDKEKVIREAEGYAADRVPKARGEAEQTILAATAYREQRELKAEGDAAKFLKIVKEHEIPAAFQTLASIGIPEAVQVLAQVGIEQETLPEDDQESVAITRETLLDILDGIGVLDEGQTVEGLTGPILYQAFEQLEMADYYRAAYEKAMRLTEERLYLETMEDVLIDTEKIVIDSDAGGNLMPFLPLKDLTGQEAD